MPICPNKKSVQWENLINGLKEKYPNRPEADINILAHMAFLRHGDIPDVETASSLIFKGQTGALKSGLKTALKSVHDAIKTAVKGAEYEGAFKTAEARLAGEIAGKRIGRKEGRLEQTKAAKEFANRVVEYIKGTDVLKGRLTDTQVKAIAKKASTIGVSERSFAKFSEYVDKVIDNANYAKYVEDAKSYKSKLKNPMADAKDIVKRMKQLDVEELSPEEIVKYNEVAKSFVDSKRSVTSKDYAPFNVENAKSVIGELENANKQRFTESIKEAYGILELTPEQASVLDEFMKSEDQDFFLDNLSEAKKKDMLYNLQRVTEYSNLALQEKLSTSASIYEQKYGKQAVDKLNRISNFDVTKIEDPKQLSELTRIIDNAIINESNSGIDNALSIVRSTENISKIEKAVFGLKIFDLNSFKKIYYDTPIILKAIFGDRTASAAFRALSGYEETITASGQSQKKAISKWEAFDKFRKSLGLKDDAITDYVTGVFSRLNDVSKSSADADFLNEKTQLELSIEMKKKSEKEEDILAGKLLESIYEEAIRDVNTHADFVAKFEQLYPNEVKASRWVSENIWREMAEPYRIFSEQAKNQTYDESLRENHHPKSYVRINEKVEVIGPDMDVYFNETLNPKDTGRAKERLLKDKLPKDKAVDYRFEYNTFRTYQTQLFEMDSFQGAKTFYYMSKLGKFDGIFGGTVNANFVKDMYMSQYAYMSKGKKNMDVLSKTIAVSVSRTAKNIGSAIALGRVTQVITQSVPFVNTMWQNPRYTYDVLRAGVSSEIPLFDYAPIGARGLEMGAVGRAETAEVFTYTKTGKTVKDKLSKFSQWTGRNRYRVLKPLAVADDTVARKSFLSFYLKYMNEVAGIETKAEDLSTEHLRMDDTRRQALSYAQQAVDETQAASSKAMFSEFKRGNNAGAIGEIARNIVMPFNNFASNMRARTIEDGSKLIYGNGRQRVEAGVDLVGTTIEAAAFSAINAYVIQGVIRFGMKAIMKHVFNLPDDKKFDDVMSSAFKTFYTGMTREMTLSGFGGTIENSGIETLNRLAFWIASDADKRGEGAYYDWIKKDPMFKPQVQPKGDGLENVISQMGGYGIALRTANNAYDEVSGAIDGETVTKYSWEKYSEKGRKEVQMGGTITQSIDLKNNERNFYMFMGLLNGAALLTGYSDADIMRAGESYKYTIERAETPKSGGRKGRRFRR